MIDISQLRSQTGWWWFLAAIFTGLLVATQPPSITLGILPLIGFMLLAAITPLTVFVMLLIIAPIRALFATESPFHLPLDLGQLALLVLLATWAAYHIARRQQLFRLIRSPFYIPVIVFIIGSGLSIFSATSMGSWLSEWIKWLQIALLIFLVLNLAGNQRWQWLLFGLILSGTANALVGFYEFLGGSGADHLLINDRFFRAFGTFGQPNPFGGFMGLLAPLAIMATVGYGLRYWHQFRATGEQRISAGLPIIFYASASLIIIGGLFISWSRGAWLAFVVTLASLAFAFPRKWWHSLLFVTVIAGIVGTLWFSGKLPASVVARVNSATEEFFAFNDVRGVDITPQNYAVVERLAHWGAAFNMIQHNPWLGVGFGNYEIAYPDYRLLNWHEPLGHAHNYYLNIWAEAGIIGFLSYGAMWVSVFWLTWRTRQHPDVLARCIAIGLFGTWTYLSIHSLLDNLYVNNLFLHIGTMIGILAVLYNQVKNNVTLRGNDPI